MSDITIIEAYSRLKSLRKNVPDNRVQTKYVDEYHQILDLLQKASGTTLTNFRIPPSEVHPFPSYYTPKSGTVYTEQSFCDYPFFMMKVDAVLAMFEVLVSPSDAPGRPIGFNPS